MSYILKRLTSRPDLMINIIVASFFVNILGLASSLYVIQVFNRYLGYGTDATLYSLTAGMIVAITAELLFRYIRYRFVSGMNVLPEFYEAYHMTSFLTQVRVDHVSGSNKNIPKDGQRAIESLQSTLSPTNITAVIDTPFAIIFVVAVFLLSTMLGFILVGLLACGGILTYVGRKNQKKLLPPTQKANEDLQKVNSSALQIDTIHSFNAGDFIKDKWKNAFSQYLTIRQKSLQDQSSVQSLSQTLGGVLTLFIIFFGAQQVIAGQLSIGALIGANIIASRAFATLNRLISLNQALAQASFMGERLQSFKKLPLEKSQGTKLKKYYGNIAFSDLSYRPPFTPSPLFENINFQLEPGSSLVVTGNNSTGKTTFARIMLGLVAPSSGQVLVSGTDLRQIVAENWRSHISYLPQEPQFVEATIRENIRINAPDLSDGKILDILHVCDLGNFIRNTPDGLAHKMSNDPLAFSLGIKRRIAFARALASNGALFIIDEPFSSLDKGGKKMMRTIINELQANEKTIVICDHDLEAIPNPTFTIDLNKKI